MDTGIDVDHPEFAGRLYVNPGEIPGNFIDDDGNGYIDDVSGWNGVDGDGIVDDTTVGHGTRVSSVLLANSNNNYQIAGFDHFARLLPLKALDQITGPEASLVAALDYLILNPDIADVVNMSLANYDESPLLGNTLSALAQNSILIGGSGNGFSLIQADIGFPESHPDVITVAGTDQFDERPAFSDGGLSVNFAAPAVEIFTASWSFPNDFLATDVNDGTSFAAPMVAGIASLGFSIQPNMTKSALEDALRNSAVDLGPPGRDVLFGWGRVNAHQALQALNLIFEDGFESGNTTAWTSSTP